jgi:tRNA threonylcarbamoyladenosine biosynthesis protein TsaB
VIVLGFDTATSSTAVAVLLGDGTAVERRDDPPPGERPAHAARLLELAEAALAAAGTGWDEVERLAVGIGPGGFTGLRIGIATARALAQGRGLEVVGVGSLDALAAGAREAHAGPVLAVLDARRGEAFVAAWDAAGARLRPPAAVRPENLPGAVASLGADVLAVGDGAVRFRDQLERAGARVPADESPVHRISAVPLCRLGAAGRPADRDALVPDYVRAPDATPPSR